MADNDAIELVDANDPERGVVAFLKAQETAFDHLRYPPSDGEVCSMCGKPAWHKVGEHTEQPRHEFTAYVCCSHFGMIMGRVATAWCTA